MPHLPAVPQSTPHSTAHVATPAVDRFWPRTGLCAMACAVALLCTGCAVVAVADAAVTVVSTTVKVGATVVGTTVDVGAAGVRAVVGKDEE